MLDKHAPFKTFTKKKQKQNMKLWVTSGIQRSMKMRDKIYKQMVKSKAVQNKQHNLMPIEILQQNNRCPKDCRQSYYHFFLKKTRII